MTPSQPLANTSPGRVIVVTGCDVHHHHLASELIASLRAAFGARLTIGFIRVGDEPLPTAIADGVDHVVHIPPTPEEAERQQGFRIAQRMLKPRIVELFPGFDVYVWLDGDTWVMNGAWLPALLRGAALADVCMHPELDPNYYILPYPHGYVRSVYASIYGAEEARRWADWPMINCGVLAARAASPLWGLWREAMEDVRARQRADPLVFFSDQIPLHRLIAKGRLTLSPLRAANNWLAGLCPPGLDFDRGRVMAPSPPYEDINLIHLIGDSKTKRYDMGAGRGDLAFRYPEVMAALRTYATGR